MRRIHCRVVHVTAMLSLGLCGLTEALAIETTTDAGAEHDHRPDQILLINTRGLNCRVGATPPLAKLRARELNADGSAAADWVPPPRGEDFANQWLFVHGNQIPPREAIRRGLLIYHRLRRSGGDAGPVRFVIWSWPSERYFGRIRDARDKARRTDVESFLLGSYLAEATHREPMSLVGYSFGARIISGALHLAGGGCLAGHRLADLPDQATTYRVSFMAAAVERDGFLPGGRYGRALHRVDHLLLMNNSRDPALNFFWVIDPKRKPKALGDTGIGCIGKPCQVTQFDWARSLRKVHSLQEYLRRPAIMNRVARHVSRVVTETE